MPAMIRSRLYQTSVGPQVGPTVTGASRNDLMKGYRVVCESVNASTTYSWSLVFTPDSPGPTSVSASDFAGTPSAAGLLPPENSNSQTCKFDVDWDGSYLIRLVTDAGLPTEDTQFIRLRGLTTFGNLKLVAAGERRDQYGIVPVDATPEGWSDDQNQNLQRLMLLLRRVSTGSRILYVDANRGRAFDSTVAQDDPTRIVRFPGPDPSARDESGMRATAVGYGDFSTIQEAIDYAVAAAGRGEPVPSSTNPYYIKIRPGTYLEGLVLAPFVHLLADSPVGEPRGTVTIRTTATNKYHSFTAASGNSELLLSGLLFLNSEQTTQAILEVAAGGIVYLFDSAMVQVGAKVDQGGCIHTAGVGTFTSVQVIRSRLNMNGVSAVKHTVNFEAPSGYLSFFDSTVSGPNGVRVLSDPFGPASTLQLLAYRSEIAGRDDLGRSVIGYPNTALLSHSTFVRPLEFTPVGGAYTHNVEVHVNDIHVSVGMNAGPEPAAISFDASGTAGATTLHLGTVDVLGTDSTLRVLDIPSAPGAVPTIYTLGQSRTQYFDNDYVKPEDPGAGSMNPLVQLPASNVQEALSLLTRYALPLTGAPYYSLESAYNGLANLWPVVPGSGLGRTIEAGSGAVQITRATPPVAPIDTALNGSLQVEGVVDLGPLMGDGLGSEILINPNTFGAGPQLKLGRNIFPNVTGLPSTSVFNFGATGTSQPFHHTVHTANGSLATVGAQGNISLVGGSGVGSAPPGGGHVVLQGGSMSIPGASTAGHVWVAPGHEPAAPGRMQLVKLDTATAAVLTAANVFGAANTATGYFYIQTVNGVEKHQVLQPDNLAALIIRINNASLSVLASNSGGKLRLTSLNTGPSAFILYMTDDQTGAVNTKVGNLTSPAATYTAGAFIDYVGLSCTAAGNLHVHGSVSSDVPIGGGGFTYQPIAFPGGTVGAGNRIVGVSTIGGATTVTLPAVPTLAQVIIIKHETGTLGAGAPVQSLILDPGLNPIDNVVATVTFNAPADNGVSRSVYWSGTGWFVH